MMCCEKSLRPTSQNQKGHNMHGNRIQKWSKCLTQFDETRNGSWLKI